MKPDNESSVLSSAVATFHAPACPGLAHLTDAAGGRTENLEQCLCSYCKQKKRKFLASEEWIKKRYRMTGLLVKIPICTTCADQLKRGNVIFEVSESDATVRTLVESLKEKSHWLAVKGGSLDELNRVMDEFEACSEYAVAARAEFEGASLAASKAAAKVEWLRKIVEEARDVIERKTKTTYEYCRMIASRAISNPSVRSEVFDASNFCCKHCGGKDFLSVDHIVSVKNGGRNEMENYQCLCISCNSKKGAR